MDGKTLIVQAVPFIPFTVISPAEGRIYGLDVDIVNVLAGKLNFQVRMELAMAWDLRHKNGSFGGMMGAVSTATYFALLLRYLPELVILKENP